MRKASTVPLRRIARTFSGLSTAPPPVATPAAPPPVAAPVKAGAKEEKLVCKYEAETGSRFSISCDISAKRPGQMPGAFGFTLKHPIYFLF